MGKIFVIDDEVNIQNMVQDALEGEGYTIQCFSKPKLALEQIEQEKPDIVITDMRMPEMNGLELIRKAKTIYPELNIILMTAYASLDSAIDAIRSGANDYLVKPFKIDALFKQIGFIPVRI